MKNLFCLLILLLCLLKQSPLIAQVNYTANERVARYGEKSDEYFLYGANMDWKNAAWTDEIMGTILCSDPTEYGNEGPNANSLRPALYDRFVAQYGVEYRIPTFKHYAEKGAKVNTIFLSGPRKEYWDRPCPLSEKEQALPYDLPASFKNLYEPIWITKNGNTEVNPENYYAKYVYDVVKEFKPYARFWEIWNEPDLTYNGNGDKGPNDANNWWTSDPDPCELHNLRSPIQNYVRLLRISYEVIKTIDPEAIVCTGGIGYTSFLDAILRNTDNPDAGKVTTEYPNKGGAYFDYVSFHVYPMYYLRKWMGRNEQYPDGFKYFRHTDKAIDTTMIRRNEMVDLLLKYGYDGNNYPKKGWILSETNLPSRVVKDLRADSTGKVDKWYIGSDEAQRNYLTKIAIECQKENMNAIYVFRPYDISQDELEGDEYKTMGFYEDLPDKPGAKLTLKPSGKAWRTMVKLLSERKYSESQTSVLNLESEDWAEKVKGAAFHSSNSNDYIYVLWAKTSLDNDESAHVEYEFPTSIKASTYTTWDDKTYPVENNKIALTGSPVFIKASVNSGVSVDSVRLNKKELILEINQTDSLIATVFPKEATNKKIIWKSADATCVSVDTKGKIKALKTGATAIIATSAENENIFDSCYVYVKSAAIVPVDTVKFNNELSKNGIKLNVGDTTTITAIITPANATNKGIRWGSSNDKIASVDENGKVTALKSGRAYINAYSIENSSKRAACKVEIEEGDGSYIAVSGITLNSTRVTIHKDNSHQLIATIQPVNATNKAVKWKSSDESIVSVDTAGLLTALRVGNAEITVSSSENGKYATKCNVIVVEKDDPIISVTGIELNKSKMVLYEGEEEILFANIKPSNATNKKVLWKSDDENIAKVDEDGVVTALLAGIVNISVYSAEDDIFYATCEVTVKRPILYIPVEKIALTHRTVSINIGKTERLTYKILPIESSNKNVKWVSDNPAVVSVDENGYITGNSKGSAKVTITSDENPSISDNCTVTVYNVDEEIPVLDIRVEPSSLTLYAGDSERLEAIIYPRSASDRRVGWSSNDTTILSVNESGYVKALKPGTVTISAYSLKDPSIINECKVIVVNEGEVIKVSDVQVNKSVVMIEKGETEILYTRILPHNATNKNLIWSSDKTFIGVDQTGAVHGHNIGDGTITVRSAENNNIFYEVKVYVIEQRNALSNLLPGSEFIKLYPNPVKNELFIEGTKGTEIINVYSSSGQQVFATKAEEGITRISVVNYKEGIYFVKVGNVIRKILKQ